METTKSAVRMSNSYLDQIDQYPTVISNHYFDQICPILASKVYFEQNITVLFCSVTSTLTIDLSHFGQ